MKIYSYLYREILIPFMLLTVCLLALLIATELSDTLTKVITGQYSDNAILYIIGYQIFILLPDIIPAAYFLACLTTLQRLSKDSERVILYASGLSDTQIAKKLIVSTSIPVLLLLLILLNFVTPLANRNLEVFIQNQANRPLTDLVLPTSFHSMDQINTTLYAEAADNQNMILNDVFTIQSENSNHTIILSEKLRSQSLDDEQYLNFTNGSRTVFSFNGQSETESYNFSDMNIRLSEGESSRATKETHTLTSIELTNLTGQEAKYEIAHRINSALFAPLFCIWAIALTRYKPRSSRAGAMTTGVFLYILTNFAYRTLNNGIERADISLLLTPWWFILGLGIPAFLMIYRKS